MAKLDDAWNGASVKERYNFLLYLHKAYNFGKLCRGVIGKDECYFYNEMMKEKEIMEEDRHG